MKSIISVKSPYGTYTLESKYSSKISPSYNNISESSTNKSISSEMNFIHS